MKVYIDFDKTPFYFNVGRYVFYFSTELHRNKFAGGYLDHREQVSQQLSKRYRLNVRNDFLSDLNFYVMIENRGFRIVDVFDRREYKWRENIELNGVNLIQKSLNV